jgi:hypothetical protein
VRSKAINGTLGEEKQVEKLAGTEVTKRQRGDLTNSAAAWEPGWNLFYAPLRWEFAAASRAVLISLRCKVNMAERVIQVFRAAELSLFVGFGLGPPGSVVRRRVRA